MFVDPLRQVNTWLSDATNGVNAIRTQVPNDAGDTDPAAVTVLDAATTTWVARGLVDRAKVGSGPLLLVQPWNDGEAVLLDGEVRKPAEVQIAIRFAVRKSDAAAGLVQAWSTLRCAARSLMKQAAGLTGGSTTRNTTTIGPVLGMRYLSLLDELQDDFVVDALVVTLQVTDPWAVAGS